MKRERPILFSGAMVRAILEGRKTQTRRVVRPRNDWHVDQVPDERGVWRDWPVFEAYVYAEPVTVEVPCPYGQPGDRLWVRETWQRAGGLIRYDADGVEVANAHKEALGFDYARRPSIHMPRWASRLTLEVTGVKVERLNDISEEDALAEGVDLKSERWPDFPGAIPLRLKPRYAFECLWASINGPDSWKANPWVWAVSFKRVTP